MATGQDRRKRRIMALIPVYQVPSMYRSIKYEMVELGPEEVVTVGPPDGTVLAIVKVEGGGVRYCDDGQQPTKSFGMPLFDGDSLNLDVVMNSIQIAAREEAAYLHITYYGASL